MATIDDYASGRIVRSIRYAHAALGFLGLPLVGPVVKRKLERRMEPFCIRPVSVQESGTIIDRSSTCAAGPRVCRALFPESVMSESVFLDALADAMAGAGRARPVTKDQAKETLGRYSENPLILSKVSGRYREICRSDPAVCIYWKMRNKRLIV